MTKGTSTLEGRRTGKVSDISVVRDLFLQLELASLQVSWPYRPRDRPKRILEYV